MSHTATYSPQDDKLRLYFDGRIPKEQWNKLRANGWAWCMKQAEAGGANMSAVWTPNREDEALDLIREDDPEADIGDEDQPREERSADRADRFENYGDKRESEAHALADRHDAGPAIHANQSQERAERAAQRQARIAERAATQWSKADYWTSRTAGVIRHALYLERADVRHRRIKGLEAELRKKDREHAEAVELWNRWQNIASITDPALQTEAALNLSGSNGGWFDYQHPTNPARRPASLWSLLDPNQPEENRITGAQACALWFALHSDPTTRVSRWAEHYRMRIAYENQMLSGQGGTAASVEMVAGGWIGKHQIQKVTKDRAGRVNAIYFLGPDPYHRDNEKPAPLVLHRFRAEKLKPGDYRAPSAEDLAALASQKAEAAKDKPKGPPLVNPTDADAERLQMVWNAEAARLKSKPATVRRVTAAEYQHEKLIRYGYDKPVGISRDGREASRHEPVYARVRRLPGVRELYAADCVVIITDSTQKPIPIPWVDPFGQLRRRIHNASSSELYTLAREAGMTDMGPAYRGHGDFVDAILKHLEEREKNEQPAAV